MSFDVQPRIINGRTLVPFRAVCERLGATVRWDSDARTVTAIRGDTVVVMAIGSKSPTINGVAVAVDQPAIIVDGRALVPVRFIAKAFGGTVNWNASTRTVSITRTS